MKPTLLTLLAGLAATAVAPAASIAWITVHPADDTPSGPAAGSGFTAAPDVGFTNLLTANGHTVTRVLSSATPNPETLNGFDLVIVGRAVPSSHYQNAGATAWNTTITAPVLLMSGYAIRQNRLGLMAGNAIPDASTDLLLGAVTLTANVPGSPLFDGLALNGAQMANPYVTSVGQVNGHEQRGPSIVTGGLQGGGTVLASVFTAPNADAVGGTVAAFWPAGASVTHAQGEGTTNILAGDRGIFLAGSREFNISSDAAGIYDLTPDGEVLFLNMVDLMAIPEPGSALLVAFGGALLGLRRRRSA